MAENKHENVHAALERLRGMVRECLKFKDQIRFLAYIDHIEQQVSKGAFQMENLQGTLVRAKSTSRKVLHDNPLGMVKLLNGFDSLEEELVRAIAQMR